VASVVGGVPNYLPVTVGANVARVEHSRRDLLATFGGDISPALSRSHRSYLEALQAGVTCRHGTSDRRSDEKCIPHPCSRRLRLLLRPSARQAMTTKPALRMNVAFAATFLVHRSRRRMLMITSLAAALLLQTGRWLALPPVFADHTAVLLQQNLSVGGNEAWTDDQMHSALREFSALSLNPQAKPPDLIVWPESPAPFQSNDPSFRQPISELARKANTWLVIGSIGVDNPQTIFNSASLISPAGEWTARYSKIHLVPFGEYVPFASVFSFASGLTQAVGNFTRGTLHEPLQAGNQRLGIFICYESIFPNEVRQLVADGADVLVNISNDGWYGDSGAWSQHLNQARMRAVENNRWLLRDTNTGLTASIDPYGRIVARLERKTRAALVAPYAPTKVTTFYSRHGDWFAYLCAIISIGALVARFTLQRKTES
jgi:apolipoprotein N-acyltransferase